MFLRVGLQLVVLEPPFCGPRVSVWVRIIVKAWDKARVMVRVSVSVRVSVTVRERVRVRANVLSRRPAARRSRAPLRWS